MDAGVGFRVYGMLYRLPMELEYGCGGKAKPKLDSELISPETNGCATVLHATSVE